MTICESACSPASAERSAADRPRLSRTGLSLEAVEIARGMGDPAALAYALEGRYAVLYDSPSSALEERLSVAGEMTTLALRADDKERAVHGRFGRFIALMEGGDVHAAKVELAAMQELADTLRQPAQRWIATASSAGMALFEGRFDESDDLIDEALRFGEQAQRGEAVLSARIQRLVLGRHRGRLAEMQDTMQRCIEEHPRRVLVRSLHCHMSRELGHTAEARTTFERLIGSDVEDLAVDNDWLVSLTLLSEVAEFLGDRHRSERLYDVLRHYAGRNALNIPEIVTGSGSRSLALLSATMGRWEQAERHFEDALEMNARMGARPWLAYTLDDYGRMLLHRVPPDPGRARALASHARDAYRRLGMQPHAERASSRVDGHDANALTE